MHISNLAIKKLGLTQLWWLVVNQNPLKDYNQKISLAKRIKSANGIKKNYKIKVLNLEHNMEIKFSYDTINLLKKSLPSVNFFWIIGADNLYSMHLWYNWKELFHLCPVIVFNRPGYLYKALSSKTAKFFWRKKVNIKKLKKNNKKFLPMWAFVDIKTHKQSSSHLRINKNGDLNERFS